MHYAPPRPLHPGTIVGIFRDELNMRITPLQLAACLPPQHRAEIPLDTFLLERTERLAGRRSGTWEDWSASKPQDFRGRLRRKNHGRGFACFKSKAWPCAGVNSPWPVRTFPVIKT